MKMFKLVKLGFNDGTCGDLDSCRVGVATKVKGQNGRLYSVEFAKSYMKAYRRINKRTGQPLKKPVLEIINPCALYASLVYKVDEGGGRSSAYYGDAEEMAALSEMNLDYSIKGIEAALEHITGERCKVAVIEGFNPLD